MASQTYMKKHVTLFLSSVAILGMVMPYAALAQVDVPGIAPTVVTPAPKTPPPIRVCPLERNLTPGVRGDEVKALQAILSQDTSIYPQGIASGFYGNLTQEAVKRLQQRSGIPVTGIVDNDTRDLLFPCMTLRIVSPNGGESWRVGETQKIAWEVDAPYYIMQPQTTTEGRLKSVSPTAAEQTPPTGAIRPLFQHLSIDLVKLDGPQLLVYPSPVFYHIGSAPLYGERAFAWTIPQTIPESKAYKVRISLWKNVPQPFECKDPSQPCPLVPPSNVYPMPWRESLWDESDDIFAILGGVSVSPLPSPTPGPDLGKLRALKAQLEQAMESIQKAIVILNELLGGRM